MATNRRERAKPVSRFCFMAPMLLLLSSAYPCPSLDIHPQDKSSLLLFRSWLHDTSRSLSPCLPSNPNCSSWTGLTLNNVAALDCSGERLECFRILKYDIEAECLPKPAERQEKDRGFGT